MSPLLIGLFYALSAASVQGSPPSALAASSQAAPAPDECASLISEYRSLLAIPNVASDPPGLQRNADRLRSLLIERGLAAQLLTSGKDNAPAAVYAEWRVPDARRTYVLYAHYDGQPINPGDWKVTTPFEPVLLSARADRGGRRIDWNDACTGDPGDKRIYARSAADDKLGVFAILAALGKLRRLGQAPAFNLKIFFEGEEEAGSPNLQAMLEHNRDILRSDGWIIIDGPADPSGVNQISLGVRGDTGLDVTVYGPSRPLHSGHFGNWAPNPAMNLSRLLASMADRDGHVLIKGFYADTKPPTRSEIAELDRLPRIDAKLRDDLGLARSDGQGRRIQELMLLPSLNVNGIKAADVGRDARNVIPAEATASLDLRLAKGDDYRRQLERVVAHVKRQGFHVTFQAPTPDERRKFPLIARLVLHSGYNAERTPLNNVLARDVIRAVRSVGPAFVLPTLGGSLPLYVFRQTLGAPTITVSLSNEDSNQHAEDENVRLKNIWSATTVATAIMSLGIL